MNQPLPESYSSYPRYIMISFGVTDCLQLCAASRSADPHSISFLLLMANLEEQTPILFRQSTSTITMGMLRMKS